jgi:hypothetical protein
LTRALLALAAALFVAALSGCGEDTEAAPKGSPADRHGSGAVDTVVLGEEIRARLVAASDLYAERRPGDARIHLRVAAQRYPELSPRVAREDARLDREIRAGFERVDALMAERVSFDEVRDLLGPLSDQLLGGALVALVDDEARGDRGLEAEVARRLMTEMAGTFAQGSGAGPAPAAAERLSLQYSYGLLDRAVSIARGLAKSIGTQKEAVSGTLTEIREESFPEGVADPTPQPPEEVAAAAARVNAALARRYSLDG